MKSRNLLIKIKIMDRNVSIEYSAFIYPLSKTS